MKLDITAHKGKKDLPACIFIHGLSMNKDIWIAPSEVRILGGLFPFSSLIKTSSEMKTLYHDFMALGYTVVAWSQSRPAGPAGEAVKELKTVVEFTRGINHSGIILIGHSRGGLIARRALAQTDYLKNFLPDLKALITLASPHHGSTMAKWAIYLSPLASFLRPIVSRTQRGTLTKATKRMLSFLESKAVKELLPGSDFLKSLKTPQLEDTYCLSTGGTNPALIKITSQFSIPDSFEKLLPERVLPEEMIKGKGDGLVSLRSSILPFADEHLSFHVNHAEILVDKTARETIIERINQNL
jgi:pimeloyl-ACP methyl ester carboxylesterase